MKSILAVLLTVSISMAEACTGLALHAKDGSSVSGRTLEFGIQVDTSVAVIPRGYQFTAATPSGPGMSYKAKYAAVGAIAFDYPALMDGMNEAGLSVGTFYFPGYASYVDTTAENKSRSLSPIDFPNWILTQFSTLDEVVKGIKDVVIAPTVGKGWGNTPPPFHYVVYDKEGKCLVIEPLKGKLELHENPLGTITNSPTIIWQLTNLRNFINLSPNNVAPIKVAGMTLAPFGQGSGMVGLPGDFTPPSRFVRASIFALTATPSENAQEAVFQIFHILNQFDIPIGIARETVDGVVHTDYTLVTCVRDPNALRYYFKTYEDQTIRMVDLRAFDLQAKEIKKTSTKGRQTFVDISKELVN